MIMTRSYQQSIFLYSLSKALRTTDIDRQAKLWNESLPKPHVDVDDKKLLDLYGEHAAQLLNKPGDTKLFERVQTLEQELAQARLKRPMVSTGPNVSDNQSLPAPPPPVEGQKTTGIGKFSRGTKGKHLGTDAPQSSGSRDVNAWIKRALSPALSKKVASTVSEIKELLKTVQEDHTDFILRVLIDWGLPVALAGTMNLECATKVLAAVSLI